MNVWRWADAGIFQAHHQPASHDYSGGGGAARRYAVAPIYSIVGIKVGKLRLPLSQGRDCEPQLSRETKTKPFIHLSVVFFAESHCQLRIWLNDEKKKNKRKKYIHRLVSLQAIDIGLVLDTSKPPHNETKSSHSFFSRASQDYQPSSTASVPLFSLYNHMVIYFFLPIARKSVALVFGLATSCVCLALYISIEVSAWSQVRYTYFKTKP